MVTADLSQWFAARNTSGRFRLQRPGCNWIRACCSALCCCSIHARERRGSSYSRRDRNLSPAKPVQQLADRRLDRGQVVALLSIQEAARNKAVDVGRAHLDLMSEILSGDNPAIGPCVRAGQVFPNFLYF